MRILGVFTAFVQEFVKEEKISGCMIRDMTDTLNPKVGFVKEIYMIGVPPSDKSVFDHSVQTQAFVAHFEKQAALTT
jgi:hypothetical protein